MKPCVFIGSSTEGLEIAYAIQEELEYDCEITVWPQGIFTPSGVTLDDLIHSLHRFDFGIFVFSPDDNITSRGMKFSIVRDNVIFELGMFISRLGRERCFFIVPRKAQTLRIPTDLWGVTPLTYDSNRSDENLRGALGPACNKIRKSIKQLGLIRQISVASSVVLQYPREITNKEKTAIEKTVDSILDEATETGMPASLLFIDIDRFSAINKWYGPDTCDEVIKILHKKIKGLSKDNYVKRLGGDQFLVCIPNKTLAQSIQSANTLAKSVSEYQWEQLAPNLFVTLSIGAAHYKLDDTAQKWIVRAIHGSINAKKAGGNRVSRGPIDLPNTISLNYLLYLS
jgi:diguanylate cyclase (GGDEF)-like protein